jgi:hypothetical protein
LHKSSPGENSGGLVTIFDITSKVALRCSLQVLNGINNTRSVSGIGDWFSIKHKSAFEKKVAKLARIVTGEGRRGRGISFSWDMSGLVLSRYRCRWLKVLKEWS